MFSLKKNEFINEIKAGKGPGDSFFFLHVLAIQLLLHVTSSCCSLDTMLKEGRRHGLLGTRPSHSILVMQEQQGHSMPGESSPRTRRAWLVTSQADNAKRIRFWTSRVHPYGQEA